MRREALAVYPIIDLAWAGDDARGLVAAAVRGGATAVQLRDKRDEASRVVELAREIQPVLAQAGVLLMINDRLDLALAVGADGVHLGQRDMAPATARDLANAAGRPDLHVGVSVTTVDEARAALEAGADHLSVSPVFGTATKPDLAKPAGLEGIRAIREAFPDAAIVAIGGIRAGRVAEVVRAGADGVAFISALGQDAHACEVTVRAIAAEVAGAVSEREGRGRQ